MKKKLIILASVLLLVGVLGKMVISNAGTDCPVSSEWEIQDKKIDVIEMVGYPQEMKVVIQQTEEEITKVKIEGNVSAKIAEEMKGVKFENGKLSVKLGSTSMVGIAFIPDEADELVVTIQLGKNVTVSSYLIDSAATVAMRIPAEYQGVFDLNTNNEGEIINVPETKGTDKTVIKVDTVGDIDIVK